jgi:mannose-1-phosphate guanylyltransferase
LYAVILAGGKGERFWPWSRNDKPKQLLTITGARTMLEETINRVKPLVPEERILVVAGKDLVKPIMKGCPGLMAKNIIVEPMGRNTAPAIGLAAVTLQAQDPQAVMAVLSTDHQIHPREKFLVALSSAAQLVQREDCLVTFGIPPTRPETGYGYIEVGQELSREDGGIVYRVKEFKEKPTRLLAQKFYLDRDHLWNSGMFVWKVDAVLKALATHMSELSRGLNQVSRKKTKRERDQAIKRLYGKTTAISIDYGIMEKADNVVVIRGNFLWDDVGTWTALKRIHKPDRDGNVILGDGLAMDSFECILASEDGGVIATLGVSDLIVARTPDCVLVAHASRAQDVRALVEKLGVKAKYKKYL